eukprot:2070471-Prorocentrum_lima.AAC.1
MDTVWKLKRRGLLQQGVECSKEFPSMEFAWQVYGILACHRRAYTENVLLRWDMKGANPAVRT